MPRTMTDKTREFLREMGRQGGLTRARLYPKEQLAAWGKRGGRPKKLETGDGAAESDAAVG